MSDPFVLAASLLTTARTAAPPIPLRLLGFDPDLAVETGEEDPLEPPPLAIPNVERLEPEFSNPFPNEFDEGFSRGERPEFGTPFPSEFDKGFSPGKQPEPKFDPPLPNEFDEGFAGVAPVSGAQLYQQRQTALQSGTLYTRLSSDSFYERWSGAIQQPTHQQWKALLAREAKAIAKGQGGNALNVLVGDSLSQWFPTSFLPTGKFWLNQGISGENSRQVRQRLGALSATRPTTIYVMVGINDLRQGASDREILDNIRGIARSLRSQHPGSEIVLQSILPTRNPSLSNARIRYLNRQIIYIARTEGVSYLNLHERFTDGQGQLRAELTTDGLHLNRRGYRVWQGAMQEAEGWLTANR